MTKKFEPSLRRMVQCQAHQDCHKTLYCQTIKYCDADWNLHLEQLKLPFKEQLKLYSQPELDIYFLYVAANWREQRERADIELEELLEWEQSYTRVYEEYKHRMPDRYRQYLDDLEQLT